MKKYLIAASVSVMALAAAATSANAADIIQPQQPVYTAPVFSWTGFYVGAQIGGTWADSSLRTKWNQYNSYSLASRYSGDVRKSPDASGFMGGLYLGYNYEIGNNFVVGVETDFNWMDASDSKTTTTYDYDYLLNDGYSTVANGTLKSKQKQKWAGSTRVRLGYAMDRWMPFVTAGVAYSKIESGARFNDIAGNKVGSYSASNTHTGWTIGTGVDYAVTDNVLLRLEYRYTDYGSKSNSFNTVYADGSANAVKLNSDYKTNDFRVGVAYKF